MVRGLDLYSLPEASQARFLARYRRPVARALAEAYVAAWTAPGDLVLDPFCQDATVLRTAVAAGRRAVAATSNPLLALLLRVEAAPPPGGQLEGALRQLHDAPKADAPLGEHLDQLYTTTCSRCNAAVPADAFVWDRAVAAPVLREYRCPHCSHAAREPMPAGEEPRHAAGEGQGLYRRLVAERLRVEGAPARLAERLLDLYTPRSLYALTALVLKLEVLYSGSRPHEPLCAALLHTLDEASKLHAEGEEGWRPVASLLPPRRFREVNVWRAFVAAVRAMEGWQAQPALPLALRPSPEVAPSAGACLCSDPLPRLAGALSGQVMLILSQLPRFDPTFAALSYLWSGWLLGKEGSRAALRLLQQRAPGALRYLEALQAALITLRTALAPQGRLAVVLQAPGTRYLEHLHVAAGAAGLAPVHSWHGLLDDRPGPALAVGRAEHHLVFARRSAGAGLGEPAAAARRCAVRVASGALAGRGEPAPFGALHGPLWSALAGEGLLAGSRSAAQSEELRKRMEAAVAEALRGSDALRAVPVPGDEHGAELWVWAGAPAPAEPLADRVEALVRDALAAGPLDAAALQRQVLGQLPEGQVPAWPLVWACLQSYGRPLGDGRWQLAEGEGEAEVRAWQARVLEALAQLGMRLGYAPGQASGCELAWQGDPPLTFRVQAGAQVGGLASGEPCAAGRRVLVIPTRRAGLWRHKLAAVPLWRVALARAGWAFLRDEALLSLLEGPAERARLEAALGLEEGGGQLALFGP